MSAEDVTSKSNIVHMPDAAISTRRVFVRDYVTDAQIGVWTHEKGKTQKVRLNVDLIVREAETHHDDQLDNVVCYNDIVLGMRQIIDGGHINLVETLAEKIADMVMENTHVLNVRVMAEKLEAVKEAGSVGVEVERRR